MAWTEERRRKQAEAIRRWKPWEKSTGPKTAKGKASSSLNSLKHGNRSQAMKALYHSFRLNREFVRHALFWAANEDLVFRKANELLKNKAKTKA